jgi:hypothetical protein
MTPNYEAAARALWEVDRKNRVIDAEFDILVPHVQEAYREKARKAVDAALVDIDNHVNRDLNALMLIAQLRPDQSQTS